MLNKFGLGVGLSFGSGLAYLFIADPTFRFWSAVLGAMIFGIVLALVITIIVMRQQAAALSQIQQPSIHNRWPPAQQPVTFYPHGQPQLPAPQGWVVEQPVEDRGSEVVG